MPTVQIVDYGVGNLLSLKFALEKAGLATRITPPSRNWRNADAIALPGVGSFSAASKSLADSKEELVDSIKAGIPVLGICLGLQLFFESSEEGPGKGLSLFKGRDVCIKGPVKVPHMGWNTLQMVRENELLEGVENESYVYFVHSLYPEPLDKDIICTQTQYPKVFASSIASKNIYGTQYHPEKSGDVGMKILENFARQVTR
jgi:glutamine amidotransferase